MRPYSKVSRSNLREQSYDLLRRHYSTIKPKIAAILAKRQWVFDVCVFDWPLVCSRVSFSVLFVCSRFFFCQFLICRTLSINPVAAPRALQYQAVVNNLFNAYQQFQLHQHQQPPTQSVAAPQQPVQSNTNGVLAMYPNTLGITPSASGNGTVAHTNGLLPTYAANTTANLPIHPDVKLKKLAFFDVIATLLKPSTLLPTANATRQQEGTYYFHLTPQQATDIASNR